MTSTSDGGGHRGRSSKKFLPIRSASSWLVGALCIFPLLFLAALSLSHRWQVPHILPTGFDPSRWQEVLTGQGQLGESLALSLTLSLSVATLSTVAGYLTSRAIAYSPHRRQLLLLAYIPFAFSPVILGTCLLFLFIKLNLAGTVPGVILAQTLFSYGFAIVFFMSFWTPQKKAYEDLVHTLGGSTWDAYRHALLPLSTGMLLVCFFQCFLISWFHYGITLLVGSGKIKTLPLKVFDSIREANPYYAALAACLLVLPPFLLLLVNKHFLPEPLRDPGEGARV